MKTMTKGELAARLNGMEYRDDFPKDLLDAAKKNNLVIVSGSSDDIVSFAGAINDEDYACNGGVIHLTHKGIPQNDCDDEDCPYFEKWFEEGVSCGEICLIKIFWCGSSKDEKMNLEQYESLGKPTWCYETAMAHAAFNMYDGREFYCRGLVIDLTEVWPHKSYEAVVMDAIVAQ